MDSVFTYSHMEGVFSTTHTLPAIATGRSKVACMPSMADCGGLMIGVPNIDPNTPPLDIVKVPPSMSSIARLPSLAWGEMDG